MQTEESGRENHSRLDNAMALLDPQSRRIMELWLEGTGVGEIAESLGLTERTVTVIRNSSLWKLREWIANQPCPEGFHVSENTAK